MKSVLLRLEGPLQSWATQSKFGVRDTDQEPSKSGVLGLVGSALGMDRDNELMLASLASLSLAVRVDRSGSLLRDYHTAGGGTFRGSKKYFVAGTKNSVPSERYYLQDASFAAALSGDGKLIEKIGSALRSPHWPLFLGRRSCVPSCQVFLGFSDKDAYLAVQEIPVADRVNESSLRIVCEVHPSQGGEPRYDVPLSFATGARRYGARYVRTEWMMRAKKSNTENSNIITPEVHHD